MGRVDELLRWLSRRKPTCSWCGSVVIAIAGPDGISTSACPRCDVTPATQPSIAERSPTLDHDRHEVAIAGCASCADEAFQRRARIVEPRSAGAHYPGGPRL